jgi:hypothetical protein
MSYSNKTLFITIALLFLILVGVYFYATTYWSTPLVVPQSPQSPEMVPAPQATPSEIPVPDNTEPYNPSSDVKG